MLFFTALLGSFDRNLTLGLYVIAYVLVSYKVIFKAIKNVFKGNMLDENFLMAIASIVAFAIGEYAEGVAVMLFYAVGQKTEEYAVNRSKNSISALLDLRPDYAYLKTQFGVKEVSPMDVKVGDVLVVKPGERIPVDGQVIKGHSQVDAAMLTGESLPQEVDVNSNVYSGTINMTAVIEMTVTKLFADSAVSKILKMVQHANDNKANTEKFITKFAKVYTPIVVLSALLIATVPPLLFGGAFDAWLMKGAIFLVVSCPCALVISVPLGYFGGIGGAARRGLLVKGGQFLEVLKKPNVVVLDKTGTLTKGNFGVHEIRALNSHTSDEVLRLAAHLESNSNHPIAKAIVKAYGKTIDESLITSAKEIAGKGLSGLYNGHSILIGNEALMDLHGVETPDLTIVKTVLYLAVEQRLVGIITIEDEIKERTEEGLNALRRLGVKKFVMLTGDKKGIAEEVGLKLGIDEVHSELLPGDKLTVLEEILEKEDNVVFVGDGINDAPVLTRADVGIAMGNLGSDVAIESSDVVLMNDEITTIAEGVKVSKFTSNIIIQNIVFALGIKLLIMFLGLIDIANLWIAIFGDVGVAFIAILNSGRAIYNKK